MIYTKLNRKLKSHKYNFIITPINLGGNHWIISFIYLNRKRIVILDSLLRKDTNDYTDTFKTLKTIFLMYFEISDANESVNIEEIDCFLCECLQQKNRFECGPFACYYMYVFISLELDKKFDHKFKKEISNCLENFESYSKLFFYYSYQKKRMEERFKIYFQQIYRNKLQILVQKIDYNTLFQQFTFTF